MDVTVSRRNTLYYERALPNYLKRAKEKPMDTLHLRRESNVATSEFNAEAIPLGQTC